VSRFLLILDCIIQRDVCMVKSATWPCLLYSLLLEESTICQHVAVPRQPPQLLRQQMKIDLSVAMLLQACNTLLMQSTVRQHTVFSHYAPFNRITPKKLVQSIFCGLSLHVPASDLSRFYQQNLSCCFLQAFKQGMPPPARRVSS
jgi:hypothetical protein